MALLGAWPPWRIHLRVDPVDVGLGLGILGVAASGVLSPILAVAGAALVSALVWLVRWWPGSGLVTLAGAMVLSRYAVPLGGVNVTAERVLGPLIAAALAAHLLTRVLLFQPGGLRLGWSHAGLGLFLAANAAGSALNAPRPSDSLRLTFLIAVASLSFWVVPALASTPELVRYGFHVFLAVGSAEAAFGVAITVLYWATGTNLGLQVDPLTKLVVPFGSMWEGNVFGSLLAAVLVATLGWLLAGPERVGQSRLAGAALLVTSAGLLLSLTRGAWLGALAGALVVLVYAREPRRLAALAGLALTLPAGILALQWAVPGNTWLPGALQRALTLRGLLQGQVDPISFERLYIFSLALERWQEHPVIGNGAGALGQRYFYVTLELPAWIGNLEIHALHDAGLFGLAGLALALLGPVVALARALRRGPASDAPELAAGEWRSIQVALLAACVTLLVAFQTTEATWLAYPWYIFGLGWAAAIPRQEDT